MSEDADKELEGQAVARPARPRRGPFYDPKEARARFKDLLVVFFGVYAAFVLNRFEVDRRDSVRRRQLFEVLEHETTASIEELKLEVTRGQVAVDDFDRKLAAGEMPTLQIPHGNVPFRAVNDEALFQVGDTGLLDVETLDQLRKVNRTQHALVQASQHGFQYGMTLLEPHDERAVYDPDTRQLKPRFAWYPVVLHNLLRNAQELLAGEERLLELTKARRGSSPRGR